MTSPEMTDRGRVLRLLASLVVFLGLLWGTFWGLDDHFPFGPFRMYSTTDEVDGPIRSVALEGTTEDGSTFPIPTSHFGLRRAEVDGQIERIRQDSRFLRHFVEAYERFNPDSPPLVRLRIFFRIDVLENRQPVSQSEEEIAIWEAP